MLTQFYGERLRDARTARGMTSALLAERVGVTPAAISQYEHSENAPKPGVLSRLAEVLALPEAYFVRPTRPRANAPTLYRSRSAATKRARESAEVRQRWFLEAFDLVTTHVDVPEPAIDDLGFGANPNLIAFEQIEEAATALRAAWGLGEGPIPNMAALVEARGCATTRFAFGAEDLSAFSQMSDRPVVVLNGDHDVCVRGRFDAAHELGHLILHRRVEAKVAEKPEIYRLMELQAHRFASAFLFPEGAFGEEVYSLALEALIAVKRRWRVSIQAMVKRARDLELCSQDKYERTFKELSRRGFRAREPLDDELPVERPTVLSRSLRLVIDNGVMTRDELLYRLPFSAADIEIVSQLPRGFLESDSWGDVVALKPRAPAPLTPPTPGPTTSRANAPVLPFSKR